MRYPVKNWSFFPPGYPCATCLRYESDCDDSADICNERMMCSTCARPVANLQDEVDHNAGDCHCKSSEALCWYSWWHTDDHRAPRERPARQNTQDIVTLAT